MWYNTTPGMAACARLFDGVTTFYHFYSMNSFSNLRPVSPSPRRAFTVLEMLVALAVFAALLAVVFVPLNLAANITGIGQARASSQNAAEQGVRQITSDLQRAIYIFPNDNILGVTNGTNALDSYIYAPNLRGGQPYPYYQTANDTWNNCDANTTANANTSRIDMILPDLPFGQVDSKLIASGVLVSYYCRRRDVTKVADPVNNPIVLYRAQIPYRYFDVDSSGATVAKPFESPAVSGAYNALLTPSRYASRSDATVGCTASAATANQNLRWLTMNKYGEFNLEPLCVSPTNNATNPQPLFGSHTAVLPRDVVLIAPYARALPTTSGGPTFNDIVSYVPQVTFAMSSTKADGKIDRVNVRMTVGQYDSEYAVRRESRNAANTPRIDAPQPQIARSITVDVDCPNVR